MTSRAYAAVIIPSLTETIAAVAVVAALADIAAYALVAALASAITGLAALAATASHRITISCPASVLVAAAGEERSAGVGHILIDLTPVDIRSSSRYSGAITVVAVVADARALSALYAAFGLGAGASIRNRITAWAGRSGLIGITALAFLASRAALSLAVAGGIVSVTVACIVPSRAVSGAVVLYAAS